MGGPESIEKTRAPTAFTTGRTRITTIGMTTKTVAIANTSKRSADNIDLGQKPISGSKERTGIGATVIWNARMKDASQQGRRRHRLF
jgi:hypothetical protein